MGEVSLNPFDLTGRVAIVTGGNGGLGLGMARGLAQAGAAIAIAARDRSKGQKAAAELTVSGFRCRFYPLQASSKASCTQMVEAVVGDFGRCDILINNAGTTRRKRPEQISEADWREVLDVNLSGAMFCAQAAYPHMKAAGRGKIINIGSMYSLFGAPLVAPYAASKGGLVALTRSLASAWAPDNIQVNAILPGWINSDLTQERAGADRRARWHGDVAHARRPLGRARRSRRRRGVPFERGFGFRHRRDAAGRRRIFGAGVRKLLHFRTRDASAARIPPSARRRSTAA